MKQWTYVENYYHKRQKWFKSQAGLMLFKFSDHTGNWYFNDIWL